MSIKTFNNGRYDILHTDFYDYTIDTTKLSDYFLNWYYNYNISPNIIIDDLNKAKDNLVYSINLKLDCTNNKNVTNIIGGLYNNQNCFLNVLDKGIKVYVDELQYYNNERKILINKKTFIGYIPFRYINLIKSNMDNIKNIIIKKIANKKYNKGKSIIVTISFINGIEYKENKNGKKKK